MRNDFVVFVISHGRPENISTVRTLKRLGYTGKTFVVIDNEDDTQLAYEKKFGDSLLVFDKKHYADMTDESNNFDDRRTTTHARNACFDLAEKLRAKYFLVLDDDYQGFSYRTNSKQQYPKHEKKISRLDECFSAMVRFLEVSKSDCVAMAQNGDFIGGGFNSKSSFVMGKLRRKIMNSFFCSTERRFMFLSQMNEDVNTYLALGAIGKVFLTVPLVSLCQKQTQSNASGMTDAYRKYGTYVKSFYSVMYAPSAVKVSVIGTSNERVHHEIKWKHAVPVIVSESMKK